MRASAVVNCHFTSTIRSFRSSSHAATSRSNSSFDSIRRQVRGRHSPVGWGRAGLADDRPGVLVTLPASACHPLTLDREKGWP